MRNKRRVNTTHIVQALLPHRSELDYIQLEVEKRLAKAMNGDVSPKQIFGSPNIGRV